MAIDFLTSDPERSFRGLGEMILKTFTEFSTHAIV